MLVMMLMAVACTMVVLLGAARVMMVMMFV